MSTVAFHAPAAATEVAGNVRVCEVVGFSPRFASDRTAFCVSNEYPPNSSVPTGNLIVRKSTDGMATWEPVPGAGLQGFGLAFPSQLIVSPEYPDGRALYVHVVYGNNPGLYRSTDDGRTFTNVAPLASSGYVERALSPFAATEDGLPAPLGNGRDAFAYASAAASPALVTPPVQRPVSGAPDATDLFVLPPTFPADPGIAIARGAAPGSSPTAPTPQLFAYRCDASLTCTSKLHDFPPGYVLANAGVTSDGVFYVVVKQLGNHRNFEVWRSTGAESFTRWRALNRLLPVVSPDDPIFQPTVSVVAAPDGSGRYYARSSYAPGSYAAGPPADQIYESLDGGETWRRRSFGRTYTQKGRRGTIPWGRRMGPRHGEADVYMPSADRLVVVAQTMREDGSTYTGVFCSLDRGRTWSEGCSARL